MTTARTPSKVQRLPQAVVASVTDLPVGAPFPITGDGINLRVDIRVADLVLAGAIVVRLQDSNMSDSSGTPIWADIPGVIGPVVADGVVTLKITGYIGATCPLGAIARLTITTGVGDSVTIEEVRILQS